MGKPPTCGGETRAKARSEALLVEGIAEENGREVGKEGGAGLRSGRWWQDHHDDGSVMHTQPGGPDEHQ